MVSTNSNDSFSSILKEIYNSFMSLPKLVVIWVWLVLVPVNAASLVFIKEPMGLWIALLTNIGMLPNLFVMAYERGVSKLMSIPHLLPWTALVVLILFWTPAGSDSYQNYLTVLSIVNVISLAFDYADAYKWYRGDRAIAGTS